MIATFHHVHFGTSWISAASGRVCPAMQRLLKQGTANLRSQQYQLLYVDGGVLHRQQLEDWKVLKAAQTY